VKQCKQFKSLIIKYIADEINPRDREILEKHMDQCPDCRKLIESHSLTEETFKTVKLPEESEFLKMRQDVIRSIRTQPVKTSVFQKIYDAIIALEYRTALGAAAAILLFFAGYFINDFSNINKADTSFVEQMGSTAVRHTSLSETQNSPYRFSDLKVTELDEENLELSFTVCRTMNLVRTKDDPLTKEILAQNLINETGTAKRLQTINYSNSIFDNRIKQALILAVLNDPVDAVRLRAMSRLIEFSLDEEIKTTLLEVLEKDSSVSMRLSAIEYLMQNQTEKTYIDEVLSAQQHGKFSAVRNKALIYINN